MARDRYVGRFDCDRTGNLDAFQSVVLFSAAPSMSQKPPVPPLVKVMRDQILWMFALFAGRLRYDGGFKDETANDLQALMGAEVRQPVSVAFEADQRAFQCYKSRRC